MVKPLLAEEVQALAFRGAPESAEWLEAKDAEDLLAASSDQNMTESNKVDAVSKILIVISIIILLSGFISVTI